MCINSLTLCLRGVLKGPFYVHINRCRRLCSSDDPRLAPAYDMTRCKVPTHLGQPLGQKIGEKICHILTLGVKNLTQDMSFKRNGTFFFIFHCTENSEIRGLCSTKCSSETLQNLLYFMYKKRKTHVVFFVFHFVQLYIFTL